MKNILIFSHRVNMGQGENINSYVGRLFTILFMLTVLCMFSAAAYSCTAPSCNPACGPCQSCISGTCLDWTCDLSNCEKCVSGHCKKTCISGCEVCVNGTCESLCDPLSEACINNQCVSVPFTAYTYDSIGNRTSMIDQSGTTTYTYDYLNRLTSVTNPDQKTICYQYDNAGNRTQLTDPNGDITIYRYDGNNRLIEVNSPTGSTVYQYDSLGRQIQADLPNGTYTQYTYNSQRNWLVSVTNRAAGGTVMSSYSYTYDYAGNRMTVTEADGSIVSYTYDEIYQLTCETRTGMAPYEITFKYDKVGNRTEMNTNGMITLYTYDSDNKLITESRTYNGDVLTYSYDGNGNLIQKQFGGGGVPLYCVWDLRNRLVHAYRQSWYNTVYEYDGDGARISWTKEGVKTKYINDVGLGLVQVLMETTDTNIVQAVYAYGNDLISMHRADANSYYHYDGLGSTRQLTDDAGSVTVGYIYDAFGNAIYTSGSSVNSYGFTGEQQLNEADNMVFLRARYYKPDIGRFMSRDPILAPIQVDGYIVWALPRLISLPQHLHPYVYAQNNPVKYIDPSGEHSENRACHYGCAIAGAAGAVACSLIPPASAACIIAKIGCYALVAIGILECNWKCDHPSDPWDPVDPTDPYPPPPTYGPPSLPN